MFTLMEPPPYRFSPKAIFGKFAFSRLGDWQPTPQCPKPHDMASSILPYFSNVFEAP
jgi:hypothetical protein